ncbi:hypothetical protein [Ensifer sp.]|jgi:hypothetical protein|nr:hypothetical protein [Ensifer sp.]
MLQTLANKIPRYDYASAAIKTSLALSLLFVAGMVLNGLVW